MKQAHIAILLILLFACFPKLLRSQETLYGFNVSAEYGSPSLNRMKEFLYFSAKRYHENNIPVKVANKFQYHASLRIELFIYKGPQKRPLGFFLEYGGTPGSLRFSDAELNIKTTLFLRHLSAGVIMEIPLHRSDGKTLSFQFRPAMQFNKLLIKEEIETNYKRVEEDIGLKCENLAFSFYIVRRYYVKKYTIQPYLGYHVNIKHSLHHSRHEDAKLRMYDDVPVNVDWSGFRLGIMAGIEW